MSRRVAMPVAEPVDHGAERLANLRRAQTQDFKLVGVLLWVNLGVAVLAFIVGVIQ